MSRFGSMEDRNRVEAEMRYEDRPLPRTIYSFLTATAERFPDRPALSFQLLSGERDHARTLNWRELHERVTETANLFRSLGIGPTDTVAYLLPNSLETPVVLLAGATAGIVNPINPLLDAEQIAGILRETRARVLVTLKAFPRTDVAQKAAEAVAQAPNVTHLIEIDLNRHLTGLKKFIVPLARLRVTVSDHAEVMYFEAATRAKKHNSLMFDDPPQDRVSAYFHTGGTTGTPKLAQHLYSWMIYNGWLG
ncbi:MAG: AMP-binding protein, partial [Paracoccus sp. (in: a-proteobacteria)]